MREAPLRRPPGRAGRSGADQVGGCEPAPMSRRRVPCGALAMRCSSALSNWAPSTAASCSARRSQAAKLVDARQQQAIAASDGTSAASLGASHTHWPPWRDSRPPAGQAAHGLLDEQRIAAGTRRDQVAHRSPRPSPLDAPSRWFTSASASSSLQRGRVRSRNARRASSAACAHRGAARPAASAAARRSGRRPRAAGRPMPRRPIAGRR